MDTLNVIVSGVAVFIVGEIFVRFFLTPIHKLKEVKGEIASILLFHANNYGHAYKNLDSAFEVIHDHEDIIIEERIKSIKKWNDDLSKASDETRAVAAKLISSAEGIPFYFIVSLLQMIPSKNSILSSKKDLIGLSNSFSEGQAVNAAERSDNICKLLNIQFMKDVK